MELMLMVGIGDQLCATPVVREFKRRFPDENVRFFEAYHRAIWKNNPHLNRGNHENGVRLRLDSPGNGERIAQHYANKISEKLKLAEPLVIADDTPEIFLTDDERAQSFGIEHTAKSVAINADAGWSTRRWNYFGELAAMLLQRGWAVYHVGHDGTPPLPCTRSFHNQLSVRETAVVLGRVARVVCNDTGLLHLAAAMGTTCVGTFGFIPARDRAYSTTRSPGADQACRPTCDFMNCQFSPRCAKLDGLSVRQVFSEVVR